MSDEIIKTESIETLAKDAQRLAEYTKSKNTKRAYVNDWKRFRDWCAASKFDVLPTSAETVALYITHINNTGRKPSTISRALTSINQAHLLAGLESPIDARVREILKGIRRIRGTAKTKAAAITLEHLENMVSCCDRDILGIRNKAILLVGWTAALRRSSIVSIDCDHIIEDPQGLVLVLPFSKTDQEGAGFKVGLPILDNKELCPVRALRRWLTIAEIKRGAVFRRLGKGGRNAMFAKTYKRLSRKMISIIIKELADQAGYDATQFSAHSLRAGLPTSAAIAGISERDIMRITGHNSIKTVREYIQDGSIFRNHPAKMLID